MTPWHAAGGAFPFEVLSLIHEKLGKNEMPPTAVRARTYQRQCVELRQEVDGLRAELDNQQLVAAVASLEPQRQQRQFEYARDQAAMKLQAAQGAQDSMRKEYLNQLKEQRATHAFEISQLLGEQRGERSQAIERTTRLEGVTRELEQQLRRAQVALRKGGQVASQVQEQMASELERVKDARVWSAVREEEAKRHRIEAQRDQLKAEVVRLTAEVNSRSRKHAAEMDELYTLRGRVKALQKLNVTYDVKAQRKLAGRLSRVAAMAAAATATWPTIPPAPTMPSPTWGRMGGRP